MCVCVCVYVCALWIDRNSVSLCTYTVEPLYYGHFGTLILVLITEVSSIQRSLNTLQYYTGTQNGVLILEVSATQRFVIEKFHCTYVGIASLCTSGVMYVHSHTDASRTSHSWGPPPIAPGLCTTWWPHSLCTSLQVELQSTHTRTGKIKNDS